MFNVYDLIEDDGISMAVNESAYKSAPNARNLATVHRYLSNGRCDIVGATMPALKQAIGPCDTEHPDALKLEVKFGHRDFDYEAWEETLDFDEEDPFDTEFGSTRFSQPTGSVPLSAVGDQPKAKTNTAIAELEVLEEDPLVSTYMAVARVSDRYKSLGEDPEPWYETVASWWKIPLSSLKEVVSSKTGVLSIPRSFISSGKRSTKLYGLDNYAGKARYVKERLTRDHFLDPEEEEDGYQVAVDFGWLNAAMEYMTYSSDLVRPKRLRYDGIAQVGFGVAFEARTLVKESYYVPILPDVERYKVCNKSMFFNTLSVLTYKNDAAKFLKRRGVSADELGLTDRIKAYFQKASTIHVKAVKAVRRQARAKRIKDSLDCNKLEADLLDAQIRNLDTATSIAKKLVVTKAKRTERANRAAKAYADKLQRMQDAKSGTKTKTRVHSDINPLRDKPLVVHKFPVRAGDAKRLISLVGGVKHWGTTQSEALGLLTAELNQYKVTEAKVAAILDISVHPFYHTATRAVSPDVIASLLADAPSIYTNAERIAHSLLSRYSKSVKHRLSQLTVEHSQMSVSDRYVTDDPSGGTFYACVSKWASWYKGKIAGSQDRGKVIVATLIKKAILEMKYNESTGKVTMPNFDKLTTSSIKNFGRRHNHVVTKEIMDQCPDLESLIAYADNKMDPPVSFEDTHNKVKKTVAWIASDIENTKLDVNFNAEKRMQELKVASEKRKAKKKLSVANLMGVLGNVGLQKDVVEYKKEPWRWEEDFWEAWGHSRTCMRQYIRATYGDQYSSFRDLDDSGVIYDAGLCGRKMCKCRVNKSSEVATVEVEIVSV